MGAQNGRQDGAPETRLATLLRLMGFTDTPVRRRVPFGDCTDRTLECDTVKQPADMPMLNGERQTIIHDIQEV